MLWLRLARRKTIVNNNILEQGDALYTNKQKNLTLLGIKKSEVIVFNLPMTQAITWNFYRLTKLYLIYDKIISFLIFSEIKGIWLFLSSISYLQRKIQD